MSYLGSWKIDDVVTFSAQTHDPATGIATDADSAPTYRVYEDETATPILTGTMATLDAGNTDGFYSEQITLSAANGFENGKSYTIRILGTVDGISAAMTHTLQMRAEVGSINSISANAITATAIQDGAITAAKFATDAITSDAISVSAHEEIANETVDALMDFDIDGYTSLAGSVAAYWQAWQSRTQDILEDTGTTIPAQITARTLAAASYATAANQTTILSNQATLATAIADVPTVAEFEARTIVSASYSTLTAAQVNAEVDTALADYDGPTNAEMEARTLVAAAYATAANQSTIATAIADVPTVAEFEARTIVAASYSTLTAAQVNAEVDTALADYDAPTNAEMVARTLVAASYGTAANQATIAGFLDTEIAEIITDLGTITTHLTDIKGGSFNGATDSLEEISDAVAGISSGTGSGARTITITVDDGTDPLESARVRLTKGAESYVGSTDVDGELVFNVDDGTWVVAITLPGYTFAGASLIVNGDETQTYSLTALSITPPSDPELCTGYMVTLDKEGLVVAGIDITVKLVDGPGTAGYAYERNLWVETSDVNGYVEFVGLVRGARYRIRRETSEWVEFVVPDADTVALAEVVG